MPVEERVAAQMKGIVFTEFLELIEQRFGLEIADRVLESTPLASGGIYTAVGSYPHEELVAMAQCLAAATGEAPADLLRTFGAHLFGRFAALYPAFFQGVDDGLEFLCRVEDHIHVEVRKLYPDAELPGFEYQHEDGRTTILYRSRRHFGDLAEGLIRACLEHFATPCHIERTDLEHRDDGADVRFVLTPADRSSK